MAQRTPDRTTRGNLLTATARDHKHRHVRRCTDRAYSAVLVSPTPSMSRWFTDRVKKAGRSMSPTRSRRRPPPPTLPTLPPPYAGGAADEANAEADVWMGGLESPGGGGGSGGGGGGGRVGAGRAGDHGRRYSLGQSENATLRKIEAQMEVSEWRPVEVIMQ